MYCGRDMLHNLFIFFVNVDKEGSKKDELFRK